MVPMRNRPKAVKEDGSSAQVFPDEVVHEIVARCPTVDDAIRCAATSRPIRRGILNERFLRRLVRDEGRGPFVRSVLLGVYRKTDHPLAFVPAVDVAEKCPASVATLPPAPRNRNTACRYGAYLPVASRRSLLVLRRRCGVREREHLQESHGLHAVEISVCNPTTGERRVLPPHDVADTSYAVLDVRPLSRPAAFKLLVAELTEHDPKTLSAQIFSSEDGDWGAVVYCHIARCCEFAPGPGGRPSSVVLGDTVNWLCSTGAGHRILSWRWRDNETLQKTSLIKLPSTVPSWFQQMCLTTLPSAQDAAGAPALLGLIVLEPGEVEVWVRKKKIGGRFTWELRHTIMGTDIARSMGSGDDRWLYGRAIASLSEGSGTVFLRGTGMGRSGPLLLGLDYKSGVNKLKATIWDLHPAAEFCPYEIDMLSYMLLIMRTF